MGIFKYIISLLHWRCVEQSMADGRESMAYLMKLGAEVMAEWRLLDGFL